MAGNLPDSTKGWPIQLCSTYYTTLFRTISDSMMDSDDYTAPSLISLDTKEKQLEILQIIREGATTQYKDDERIDKKIKTND